MPRHPHAPGRLERAIDFGTFALGAAALMLALSLTVANALSPADQAALDAPATAPV